MGYIIYDISRVQAVGNRLWIILTIHYMYFPEDVTNIRKRSPKIVEIFSKFLKIIAPSGAHSTESQKSNGRTVVKKSKFLMFKIVRKKFSPHGSIWTRMFTTDFEH